MLCLTNTSLNLDRSRMKFIRFLLLVSVLLVSSVGAYFVYRIKSAPSDHELISQVEDFLIYQMPRAELERVLEGRFGEFENRGERENKRRFESRSLNGEIEIDAYTVSYYISTGPLPLKLPFVTQGVTIGANFSENDLLLSARVDIDKDVL